MSSHLLIDDARQDLVTEIDRKAYDLFKAKDGKPSMQVTRVARDVGNQENADQRGEGRGWAVKYQDVWSLPQITDLRNASQDSTQIFSISQDRSWTTLNIQRELFESFMSIYNVSMPFWACMFTFGRKSREAEFQFPVLKRKPTYSGKDASPALKCENSYMLRRVESNGREEIEDESWSIRQTAVYHSFTRTPSSQTEDKSTFLLVAPSPNAENLYKQYIQLSSSTSRAVSPWNIHRILIADSLKGWMSYLASLEKRLNERSDRIVLSAVGPSKEGVSPLTNFVMSFEDRQELKMLQDSVVDLQVILPPLRDVVCMIKLQCDEFCNRYTMSAQEGRDLVHIMQEFNTYTRELSMCIERAKVLEIKSKTTTQLLSDLLSYEEAFNLKELTRKSQEENTSMRYLAERSAKDATAVKILSVITLIYLPTTIVANFFSTEFVQTTQEGRMVLANNFWLLFAIAIPLTAITILLWWAWVHFAGGPDLDAEFRRLRNFRSVVSRSRAGKGIDGDLEAGGRS